MHVLSLIYSVIVTQRFYKSHILICFTLLQILSKNAYFGIVYLENVKITLGTREKRHG